MNKCMSRPLGTPDSWICNADKAKAALLLQQDSKLVTGAPHSIGSLTNEELEKEGYVGIYTRKPDFYIPCVECGKDIPVTNADHVASVRSGKFALYHTECYPEKLGYVAPYILDKITKEEAKDENPTAGASDIRGENGRGIEKERLQGRMEGGESGNDDGKAVG